MLRAYPETQIMSDIANRPNVARTFLWFLAAGVAHPLTREHAIPGYSA